MAPQYTLLLLLCSSRQLVDGLCSGQLVPLLLPGRDLLLGEEVVLPSLPLNPISAFADLSLSHTTPLISSQGGQREDMTFSFFYSALEKRIQGMKLPVELAWAVQSPCLAIYWMIINTELHQRLDHGRPQLTVKSTVWSLDQ